MSSPPLVAVEGQQADEHRAGQASGGQRDDLRACAPDRLATVQPIRERDDQRDRRRAITGGDWPTIRGCRRA